MTDLQNHLMAQMERLADEELTAEEMDKERKRARSMVEVGSVLIESAKAEVMFHRVTGNTPSETFIDAPNKIEG